MYGSHDEHCERPAYFGHGKNPDPDVYDRRMSILTFMSGLENFILAIALICFTATKFFRNDRLTTYTWTSLIVLTVLTISVTIAQLKYGHFDSSLCNFTLHMVYSGENIILFNLLNSIGYKLYLVCDGIYEFAFHGNLPTEASKIRNERIFAGLWVASIILLLLFISMNIYWLFISTNYTAIHLSNYSFDIVEIVIYL